MFLFVLLLMVEQNTVIETIRRFNCVDKTMEMTACHNDGHVFFSSDLLSQLRSELRRDCSIADPY